LTAFERREDVNELALFAGAGGGILGGKLLGWRTVCAVEYAAAPRKMLLARQRDGCLERFPIWDDVRTFNGKPWRGKVDVISGGFPCQDISCAGKGAGIDGERSGLWKEFARIISEVRPAYAFIENSSMLVVRGLDRVICDLTALGYDTTWGVFSSGETGARHERERLFCVGHSDKNAKLQTNLEADAIYARWKTWRNIALQRRAFISRAYRQFHQPGVLRSADGVASFVDRHEAIGNGQDPLVVELAWRTLAGGQRCHR